MKSFRSWLDYSNFAYSVRRKNRFLYDEAGREFLEAVSSTSKGREADLQERSILYRAQSGCDKRPEYDSAGNEIAQSEWPYKMERMLPVGGKSFEGRANPRGITYLYLASDRDTACAEVRPWKELYISVAQFKVKESLRVVDCTKIPKRTPIYLEEPDSEKREERVWADINQAFSKPVNPYDPETEYVPTQVVAELFRTKGFNGIAYKSSYEKGLNFVLFELNKVDFVSCTLSKVKNIEFDFDHTRIGYSSKNKYVRTTANGNAVPAKESVC